jgi:hypothetical protein
MSARDQDAHGVKVARKMQQMITLDRSTEQQRPLSLAPENRTKWSQDAHEVRDEYLDLVMTQQLRDIVDRFRPPWLCRPVTTRWPDICSRRPGVEQWLCCLSRKELLAQALARSCSSMWPRWPGLRRGVKPPPEERFSFCRCSARGARRVHPSSWDNPRHLLHRFQLKQFFSTGRIPGVDKLTVCAF